MSELDKKRNSVILRTARTRSHIHGTAKRPRLSVTISHKHISAQLIDDDAMKTILAATSVGDKKSTGTMTERAIVVGETIAKKAKESKIKLVVFDRGAKKYHGRIKALADAARKEGLEF